MINLAKLILTEIRKQKWINDFSTHRHHDWIINKQGSIKGKLD